MFIIQAESCHISSYLFLCLPLVLCGHSAIPPATPPPCLFILFLTFQKGIETSKIIVLHIPCNFNSYHILSLVLLIR
jgi:hypothetical protein